jgi:anti-sigma regulatory factor (Ser/Thr protein kinase)
MTRELGAHLDVVDLLKRHGAEAGEPQHPTSESIPTEKAANYGNTDAVVELLWAAAENDIDGLRRCLAHGIPVSAADYDGRTALHLAASDGQTDAVKCLLAHDHPIHVCDRWNCTPLDDARREKRDAVVELLTAAEKQSCTLAIEADHKELARTNTFVKRYTAAHDIGALVNHRVNVVLEEVLSSIIDHASTDSTCREIALEFDVTAQLLKIVVRNEGQKFDPLSSSQPDAGDAEMSGIAGKLIRKLIEDASYRRPKKQNILTLTFRLDGPAAVTI